MTPPFILFIFRSAPAFARKSNMIKIISSNTELTFKFTYIQ